ELTPQSNISLQGEVATQTKLVDDVHHLSVSDERAQADRKSLTDLVPLLELVSGNFRHRLAQHHLTLTLDLPPHAAKFGDAGRLMKLFTN
ncbi:two-component system sensor histidine kinase BaeA, partial [Erwinia amylovora]|nr:two-component system sensor histidine kinase BaeA [Erwinia amylovora]